MGCRVGSFSDCFGVVVDAFFVIAIASIKGREKFYGLDNSSSRLQMIRAPSQLFRECFVPFCYQLCTSLHARNLFQLKLKEIQFFCSFPFACSRATHDPEIRQLMARITATLEVCLVWNEKFFDQLWSPPWDGNRKDKYRQMLYFRPSTTSSDSSLASMDDK